MQNVQRVLAVELLCAAQALEFRRPLRPGRGVAEAYERVRALVPPLAQDRVLGPEIEAVAAAVARGDFALPHYP